MLARIARKARNVVRPRYWATHIVDNFYKDIVELLTGRNPVIFYVGANVGQDIRRIKWYMPYSSIYCFEPFPRSFARLAKRAKRYRDVHAINAGVGSEAGQLYIQPHENPTMVKLVEEDTGGLSQTPVVTVDAIADEKQIEHIDILKIDVEGLELEVLKGSASLLSDGRIGCVYIECGINPSNAWHTSLDAVRAVLEPLGYRIMHFYDQVPEWPTRAPHLRRADVAFLAPRLCQPR